MSLYGIAEWYGQSFPSLSPADRQRLATVSLENQGIPACPFRVMTCNKRGGVCSIQQYSEAPHGRIGAAVSEPVIVCPNRFHEDNLVVHWLSEIVGFQDDETMLAREVPFMQSSNTEKHAGKIDLVVAHDLNGDLRWFGLEIQAVYFSGPGMSSEFEALRSDGQQNPPYPLKRRRPDWRSSGAKRLMPQLQVKGPTLRRWHSKLAVAVDWPFFASLGGPSAEPSHDLDAGDVVWLVPEIQNNKLTRGHWEILTLEESCDKLLAARTVTRTDFERVLREKLRPLNE